MQNIARQSNKLFVLTILLKYQEQMTFQHNYKYAFVIDNNYTSQELIIYYFIDYTNYTKTP